MKQFVKMLMIQLYHYSKFFTFLDIFPHLNDLKTISKLFSYMFLKMNMLTSHVS